MNSASTGFKKGLLAMNEPLLSDLGLSAPLFRDRTNYSIVTTTAEIMMMVPFAILCICIFCLNRESVP